MATVDYRWGRFDLADRLFDYPPPLVVRLSSTSLLPMQLWEVKEKNQEVKTSSLPKNVQYVRTDCRNTV